MLELAQHSDGSMAGFHLCLETDNFDAAVSDLQAREVELVQPAHKTAAREPREHSWQRVAIMRQNNRRLYRIARSILRNNTEAEDAVQEAYVSAFTHLASFRGKSTLGTWLSRITLNEALARLRRERPTVDLASLEATQTKADIIQFPPTAANDDPERTMAQRQILQLVEQATDNLPEVYRLVFVTRIIEGMSIEETADLLGIKPGLP